MFPAYPIALLKYLLPFRRRQVVHGPKTENRIKGVIWNACQRGGVPDLRTEISFLGTINLPAEYRNVIRREVNARVGGAEVGKQHPVISRTAA